MIQLNEVSPVHTALHPSTFKMGIVGSTAIINNYF